MRVKRVVIIDQLSYVAKLNSVIALSTEYTVIKSYDSPSSALKGIRKVKPDIILTEIDFENDSAADLISAAKEEWPLTQVLVITQNKNWNTIIEAIKSGASGYLFKEKDTHSKIIDVLEQLMMGGAPLGSNIARWLVESFWKNRYSPLSNRESQVLGLLSQGNTYSEIGLALSISPETSKTHIRNIYQKLKVNKKSEALKKARQERFI